MTNSKKQKPYFPSVKELSILLFLKEYEKKHRWLPSFREMANAVSVDKPLSTSVVKYYILKLSKAKMVNCFSVKGRISARTVHLTEVGEEYISQHTYMPAKSISVNKQ